MIAHWCINTCTSRYDPLILNYSFRNVSMKKILKYVYIPFSFVFKLFIVFFRQLDSNFTFRYDFEFCSFINTLFYECSNRARIYLHFLSILKKIESWESPTQNFWDHHEKKMKTCFIFKVDFYLLRVIWIQLQNSLAPIHCTLWLLAILFLC